MTEFKILAYLSIGVYLVFQLISIIPQFSGPNTITVYKKNYRDSNTYIKGYKAEGVKFETFNVKVKPKDIWDRLLLTADDDNLLMDFVKMAASLVFAYYVYNLQYDNVFSNKSFWFFVGTLYTCFLCYAAFIFGIYHTMDFWKELYAAKGGSEQNSWDFELDTKTAIFRNNRFWFYYWIFFILTQLYKTFNKHEKGEPEEV
jgi:hypothetical protein